MTEDPLHVDLQDDDLLQEVELTTTLMAAANLSDARLSPSVIDELLGVHRRSTQCTCPPEVSEIA